MATLARLARSRALAPRAFPAAYSTAAVVAVAARHITARVPETTRSFSVSRLASTSSSSSVAPHSATSTISMEQYHALSDSTMDKLLDRLEVLLEEQGDPEYEVEFSSGVLTLKLGDKGVYVINKQPPNKQIWLSSPFSGPKRYDYSPEQNLWYYARDGQTLDDLLSKELSAALESDVHLYLEPTTTRI